MRAVLITAIVITALWLLGCIGIGLFWMIQEHSLIVSQNSDGTVTYRDGPDLAKQTRGQFFEEAVRHSVTVVLCFPTAPYVLCMIALVVIGVVVWLRGSPAQDARKR